MKYLNMFLAVISLSLLFIITGCGPTAPASYLPFSKEATCMENIAGKEYKYLAWGIGDNNEKAEEDALKAALYATLAGGGAGNCTSLMNAAERAKNSAFLDTFFKDEWRNYVRSSNQGRIDPDKRLKLSSGKIKLGVEAIVAIKNLREDLQARGVLGTMRIGN